LLFFGLWLLTWKRGGSAPKFVGIGSILLALLAAGVAVKQTVGVLTHKPINVADVNDLGDSDPDSFVAGKGVAYFSAHGTLVSGNIRDTTARPHLYKVTAPDVVQRLMPEQELSAKPRLLAVEPATQELLFAIDQVPMVWRNGAMAMRAAAGTSPPQELLGIGAGAFGAFLLAAPSADSVQLYSIDLTASPPEYRAIADTTVHAEGIEEFVMSAHASMACAFIAKRGFLRHLVTCNGSSQPVEIAIGQPSLLHDTPVGLFVAGLVGSQPRLYLVEPPTNAPVAVSLQDAAEPALTGIHGIATWTDPHTNLAGPWVLATRGAVASLWRVENKELVFEQDFGEHSLPRSLIAMGSAMGFLTGNRTFWTVSGHPHHPSTPQELDSTIFVRTLWPFADQGFFAAKDKDAQGHSTGMELWRWFSDH
jgi:hypothetical protein